MDRPLVPARLSRGRRGAVVAPHHLATEAGLSMLRGGGNAVDAAIATNAALAVVASSMCGLGGDAFWLIWPGGEQERLYALNGSGRSAATATLERARASGLERMPIRGPWTVTVPGAIRSWGDAHERFGSLPWATLLGPAIELAEGFPASDGWVEAVERSAVVYGPSGDWAAVFRPRGRAWQPGQSVRLPALAGTLRRLAEAGPDDPYHGALADAAAQYLGSRGSPLTRGDLAAHRSDWADPISTDYRGVTATSHPPNSSGVLALELLNILGSFEPGDTDEALSIHRGLEAARLVFADRDALLTDPDAMMSGAVDRLLSHDHARRQAAAIDARRAAVPAALGTPAGGGTVYLATTDRWGGAVSLIESNYAGFGSGLVDPATGIAYHNRGAFFSLDPRHVNHLAPGRRTMHTLAPGMLLRAGRPWIVHGSMGGEIQPQVFAQFVSAVVDHGVDVASALARPRWAADVEEHYGPPVVSRLEARFPPAVVEELRSRGQRVELVDPFSSGMGHAHAIELVRTDGELSFAAATDPRSEGTPAVW